MKFTVRSMCVSPLIIALCMMGCGSSESLPPMSSVNGKVTLKGEPVADAKVIFNPGSGPSSTGITATDGTYSLKITSGHSGAVIGTHTVKVEMPLRPDPKAKPGNTPETQDAGFLPPENYLFQEGVPVNEGQNSIDLLLEKARRIVG